MEVQPALWHVLSDAQDRGLLGMAPLQSHVDHAVGFVDAIGSGDLAGAAILDLGSGSGIPGLVIAERCPSARLTLLDGRVQRAEFLAEAVGRLGWTDRVDVLAWRAEEAGRDPRWRGAFDLVVARAFGSPAVTAECGAPFLREGGKLVVSEPPDAPLRDPRWPTAPCAALGLRLESVVAIPWSFAVLRLEAECPARYPRRVGVPGKRPLF